MQWTFINAPNFHKSLCKKVHSFFHVFPPSSSEKRIQISCSVSFLLNAKPPGKNKTDLLKHMFSVGDQIMFLACIKTNISSVQQVNASMQVCKLLINVLICHQKSTGANRLNEFLHHLKNLSAVLGSTYNIHARLFGEENQL